MAKPKIPIRPKEKVSGSLSDIEKDCIAWMILSGRPGIECWMNFIAPTIKGSPNAKIAYEQWSSRADVKRFIKAYEETIKETLAPKPQKKVYNEGMTREQKAEEALNTFKDNVIDSLGEEYVSDVEVLKDKAQLAKTIGLLKEEEAVQLPPQRYLPTRCAECRYKQFIDEHVALGNIIDDNE